MKTLVFLILVIIKSSVTSLRLDDGGARPTNKFKAAAREEITNARNKVDGIFDIVEKMKADRLSGSSIPGSRVALAEKIQIVRTKWKTQLREAYKADSEGMAEKISGAISGGGQGAVDMINGIKNKDWKAGVKGALTLGGSLAQLGGPPGMIVASVLSFISSLLDLFGGSSNTESMDDKIERIVKEQIDIARERDLKEKVRGVMNVLTHASTRLQRYREKKDLTEGIARGLNRWVLRGLAAFGELKARINEICDITSYNEKMRIRKCLQMIDLFCELKIMHQLFMTDLATVLADVHALRYKGRNESELMTLVKDNIHSLKEEQKRDARFLRFIVDPFNYRNRRVISAKFFVAPYRYSTLQAYLETLDESIEGGIFPKEAMMCTSWFLVGDCITLPVKDYPDFGKDPGGMNNEVHSLYVPRRIQVTAHDYVGYRNDKWGPYVGPTMFYPLEGQGQEDWEAAEVKNTSRDAFKEVHICREYPHDTAGNCHTLTEGEYRLGELDGMSFAGNVYSVHIPSGMYISGCTGSTVQGSSTCYNYYGQSTVNEVYSYSDWESLKVASTEKGLRALEVCKKGGFKELRAPVKDASELVKFCTEENLGGECQTTFESIKDLENICTMKFSSIESLKLPGGITVHGFSKVNFDGNRLGSYKGPAVISKVDFAGKWRSMKISEFKKDL